MARGEPRRVRVAVRHKGEHLGYLTVTSYPDRDISAFTEGSPYFEAAVSDLADTHVALLQQFREHWLIHCGTTYATTDAAGDLTESQIERLAVFALKYRGEPPQILAASLKAHVERMLE